MPISYGRQSISWRDIVAVVRALRSPYLTQGPAVQAFESAFARMVGAPYAVAVNNATAALHLAMLALGITATDEVITSPITFLSSANCARMVGATVRLADIDPHTACMNPDDLLAQLTPATKVIIPVHFAGNPCDMDRIHHIARQHGIAVVEDASHALGSTYRGVPIGGLADSDMTIFSFHPVKPITTGEGGMITTHSESLYRQLCQLRSHGIVRDREHMTQSDGSWYYEMHHLGHNYRLTDIQSALGLSQLTQWPRFLERRQAIVARYRAALQSDQRFTFLNSTPNSTSGHHLLPVLCNWQRIGITKQACFDYFKAHDIHLQVHYIPLHFQPYYQQLGINNCPKAADYYHATISLPLYVDLSNREVDRVISLLKGIS